MRFAWLLLPLLGCTKTSDGSSDTDDELPPLIGILVAPERVTVPLGQTVQLTATGLTEDRTSLDVTHVVEWSSSAPGVAGVSNGLDEEGVVTGSTEGTAEIVAEVGDVASPPIKVTVTEANLLGLSVRPAEVVVQRGQQVRIMAEAAFSDGSRSDATNQVIWVTDNASIATLEAGGKLNGVAVGTTKVRADWDGTVSPDVNVSVVQSAGADLRVAGVHVETGPNDLTATATVQNTGGVGASDFWVDLYVDPSGAPAPGQLGIAYAPVFYLGPGESTEVGLSVGAAPGNRTVWVVVDTDDAVDETNENNNAWSGTANVGTSTPSGPNLKIRYFDYYADETTILWAVEVYNSGAQPVGEFWLDLWIDEDEDPTASGIGDDFVRVDGLGPGQTEYADFLIDTVCVFCWSWVMVDTNDEVDETDETDNVAGPLVVLSP